MRAGGLALLLAAAAGCGQAARVAGITPTCGSCHGAPPTPPAAPNHPLVATDVRYCWACHPGTVDHDGRIIPGGLHQDGKIEWTFAGHPEGYAAPAVHGRDFFAFVSGTGGPPCVACHGTAYDLPVAAGKSCNSCHAAAGWTGWIANCSFCHGTKDPATQAGYAVLDHPTWAAPPDAISQRLGGPAVPGRAGAHAIHLTGSALAGPFPCAVCHAVPTTVAHVSGRDVRAAVALAPPWQAGPPDSTGYDPATGTCATSCHGAGRSPAWSSTGIACDGCHGVPPASLIHAGIPGADLRACAACHPATLTAAAGTIDTAGGRHVDGAVEHVVAHPAGFAAPSLHGPAYLDFAGGVAGAMNCEACHGTSYGLCDGCHAQPASGGWASWRSNCTFCHGARTPAYDASSLARAAPPDAVSERLDGTQAPARTGAHGVHLAGSSIAGPMPCGSCHEVPTSLAHVDGRAARAAVALTAPGQASAPDPAGYDPSTGTCATACHGAGRSPPWTATTIACDGCHAVPPATAVHTGLSGADLGACAGCHPATITSTGAIDAAGGKHVNGMVDRVGGHSAGFDQPALHGPQYLDDVAGAPGAADCRSCHGQALALCESCHSRPEHGAWVGWETNCTFCHGTRTAAYAPASLGLASPPDAVAQRLAATPVPVRTGKHRAHLNGKVGYPGFACGACHAVPSSVSHVRVDRRAPVVFDAAAAFPSLSADELAALPSPLATYDASATPPRCSATYCHGGTLSGGAPTPLQSPPRWSSAAAAINSCAVCHGDPPDTGRLLAADGVSCATTCSNHVFHVQALTSGCDACHHGGAPVNGAALHVNGRVDVAWPDGTAGTWDPVAGTCALSCHSDAAPRPWR